MGQYWDLYEALLNCRQTPTPDEATQLSQRFDGLFATRTGYADLDDRIAKTQAKKEALPMALKHPEIPLHNNPAELAARRRVRKRDVSFGPRTEEGKQAWDTFMTLADTAKKLGVSFYHYIFDRVSQANRIPRLTDLITERAKQLRLGASWDTPNLPASTAPHNGLELHANVLVGVARTRASSTRLWACIFASDLPWKR